MKICAKCRIEKEEIDFNKSKRGIRGIDPQCKTCTRSESLAWRDKNRESQRLYYKQWHEKNPGYQSKAAKDHIRRRKQTIIEAYGGKCNCCGEAEPRFLSIDHINNDGHLEIGPKGWRLLGAALYSRLIKEGFPKDRYQLLCMNCNFGKQQNGGICPHKTKVLVEV